MSLSTGVKTRIPRVFSMIFIKNKKGQILIYKWNRQPYLGHVSLPFNRVLYGNSIFESAKEVLEFKTNLNGVPKYAGDIYVTVKKKNEVTTHYLAHIFVVKNFSGEPFADGLTGKPFWGNLKEYQESEYVNGTKEIIEIIENKKSPFFEEIILNK